MLKVYDYACPNGHTFEMFIDASERDCKQLCKVCGEVSSRLPSAPKFDTWRMGADLAFPTMADKWAKMHEEGAKKKHEE